MHFKVPLLDTEWILLQRKRRKHKSNTNVSDKFGSSEEITLEPQKRFYDKTAAKKTLLPD